MHCTREDVCEAMKVPTILGRGAPTHLVIGDQRLLSLMAWAQESDPAMAAHLEVERNLFGLTIIATVIHPDTLFALAEEDAQTFISKLKAEGHYKE